MSPDSDVVIPWTALASSQSKIIETGSKQKASPYLTVPTLGISIIYSQGTRP